MSFVCLYDSLKGDIQNVIVPVDICVMIVKFSVYDMMLQNNPQPIITTCHPETSSPLMHSRPGSSVSCVRSLMRGPFTLLWPCNMKVQHTAAIMLMAPTTAGHHCLAVAASWLPLFHNRPMGLTRHVAHVSCKKRPRCQSFKLI